MVSARSGRVIFSSTEWFSDRLSRTVHRGPRALATQIRAGDPEETHCLQSVFEHASSRLHRLQKRRSMTFEAVVSDRVWQKKHTSVSR